MRATMQVEKLVRENKGWLFFVFFFKLQCFQFISMCKRTHPSKMTCLMTVEAKLKPEKMPEDRRAASECVAVVFLSYNGQARLEYPHAHTSPGNIRREVCEPVTLSLCNVSSQYAL